MNVCALTENTSDTEIVRQTAGMYNRHGKFRSSILDGNHASQMHRYVCTCLDTFE